MKRGRYQAHQTGPKRVYHWADSYVDMLYDSPKLYRWVQAFIKAINAHSTEFDLLLMDCLFAEKS